MSIKRFVLISTFIIGSLLIALALIVNQSRSIHQQISVEEQKRINSILLSKELIQSSDDLTRMARGYATTGDPAYKDNFSQILAIRNGQVPRPYTDPSTYWHLKGTDKAHANYTGETISLIDLMRREGLLEEEIMLLEKAKQYSDKLAEIEKQAFAAVDGLVVSDSGEYVATGEHNLVLAQQLLWGAEYIDAKANIMLPVSKFLEKLNQRTHAQFDTQQTKMKQMIIQEIAILIFLFVYLGGVIIYVWRRILLPLRLLTKGTEAITAGNLSARCSINGDNELSFLGADFNRMAFTIEQMVQSLHISEARLNEAQQITQTGNWEFNLIDKTSH